MQALTQEKTLN